MELGLKLDCGRVETRLPHIHFIRLFAMKQVKANQSPIVFAEFAFKHDSINKNKFSLQFALVRFNICIRFKLLQHGSFETKAKFIFLQVDHSGYQNVKNVDFGSNIKLKKR